MQMPSGRRLLRFAVLLAVAVLGGYIARFVGTPRSHAFETFVQTTPTKIAIPYICALVVIFLWTMWRFSKNPWD